MTQHSNREPYAPWGEPVRSNPTGWWTPLLTVPALVRHLVLMFTTMAVVTAINLLTTPGTWWSLALLVIWVAVVIIHGLGILSIGVLLEDEEPAPRAAPARPARAETDTQHGPALPSWIRVRRGEARPAAPVSWELRDDTSASWPEPPPPASTEPEEPAAEQGSWRAVTDIAWHRRPRAGTASRNGQKPDAAPRSDREASS